MLMKLKPRACFTNLLLNLYRKYTFFQNKPKQLHSSYIFSQASKEVLNLFYSIKLICQINIEILHYNTANETQALT
jgi:hypothetical protein